MMASGVSSANCFARSIFIAITVSLHLSQIMNEAGREVLFTYGSLSSSRSSQGRGNRMQNTSSGTKTERSTTDNSNSIGDRGGKF
jgi:hypothetical protein